MSQPAPPQVRPATIADWEAVPDAYTAHLIDGQLYAMGRPMARHAVALGGLFVATSQPFFRGIGGPGGWIIMAEVDVKVRTNIVSPDLAGWRRERMPAIPDVTPIPLAPDWVCEVLSPSTEVFDRGVKATWYASVGVGHLWFVDPEHKTLEAYENDGGAWRPAGRWHGEGDVAAAPFAAAGWPLASLWG